MKIRGFKFATTEAAIKKPGRKDLALIYSETPALSSAVFTRNAVKAAPLLISMERIKSGFVQALVVNSGNANACTGSDGMKAAFEISRTLSDALKIDDQSVQLSSTGVIGVQIPYERICSKIPDLIKNLNDGTLQDVAEAIMTTDTFPKIATRTGIADGVSYQIAAVAKGAGMIMPDMATMLSFIVTDASVDRDYLEECFRTAVERSFNCITVDGDMSTNDTCLIMANGMASNPQITSGSTSGTLFCGLLDDLLSTLAKLIVRDGEGATKFVTITVKGAADDADAKRAAMAVANSSLVKTAFFGKDANWGRIFAAIGYSGARVDADLISLHFDDVCMAVKGVFAGGDAEAKGTEVLQRPEFVATVDLGIGNGTATVYTSDLSHEYISINADYRS